MKHVGTNQVLILRLKKSQNVGSSMIFLRVDLPNQGGSPPLPVVSLLVKALEISPLGAADLKCVAKYPKAQLCGPQMGWQCRIFKDGVIIPMDVYDVEAYQKKKKIKPSNSGTTILQVL